MTKAQLARECGISRETLYQWTLEELGDDATRMAQLFTFAALPHSPQATIWLAPYWYLAVPSQPGALLAA
jgi:DNA-binding XRE family transcriptional regulator